MKNKSFPGRHIMIYISIKDPKNNFHFHEQKSLKSQIWSNHKNNKSLDLALTILLNFGKISSLINLHTL